MENTQKKSPIIGVLSAVASGIPAFVDFIKPLIKKKKLNDNELSAKAPAELVEIIKQHQSADDETWYMFLIKRAITLATIYAVVYTSKHFGVTYNDIITLFGLL